MVNYLNPYLYGNYLEEPIIPWYNQNMYLQNLGLNISSIVTNPTESNIDNLRELISFDLEGALALNNELEQQFTKSIKNPVEVDKLSWFSGLGDKFSILGKNIGQGLSKGIDILSKNQGLQNATFGLVNSLIKPVNSSTGENTFFTAGDAFADKLEGKAKLFTKLGLTTLKVLNSAGGKRTLDFSINQNAINPVMGSYNDSSALFTDAASKAGLKYSVLNDKKRREVDAMIREARRQQNAITNLALEAEDLLAKTDYSRYLNYQNEINGNFDLRFYRVGKKGLKLENINRLKNINFTKKSKSIETLETLESSNWEPQIVQIDSFLSYQKGGSLISEEKNNFLTKQPRTLEELIAYAKEQNPRFVQRMSEPLRYVKINFKNNEGESGWNHATHMMTFTDNIVYPMVQENPLGQLFIFEDPDKALAWAELNGNVLKFNSPKEAENFAKNYKQGWKEFFDKSPIDISPDSEYEEYEPYKYKLLNLYSSIKGQQNKSKEEYSQEYIDFKNSLPDNLKNTPESEYRTYLYWQLWGKPKNFQYTLEHPNEDGEYMYNLDASDNSYHGSSIAWGKDGIGYFIKPKHHSTIGYELDWFNKGIVTEEGGKQREMTPEERKAWEDFRRNYTLEEDGNFYKYVPIKQSESFKTGGTIKDSLEIPEIEETIQKNIIPEGALHKNKHHIENTDGLTQKGIPVIDNDGDQLAEIECNELILNLKNTKFIEERYKKFYSDELTQKEKDQLAVEIGELLVQEILHNTDDRTGLIDKVE